MTDDNVKRDDLELDAWLEWKRMCELERCDEGARKRLNKHADKTLRKNVKEISFSHLTSEDFSDGYAFVMFETHAIGKTFTEMRLELMGKSYKDGIFYKAAKSSDAPLKVIRGEFKKYLRSALKTAFGKEWKGSFKKVLDTDPFANKEHKYVRRTNSLDAEIQGNNYSNPKTHYDLLANTAAIENSMEKAELVELARSAFFDIWEKLTFEHRVLVLAKVIGHPVTNSSIIQKITGINNSSSLGDQAAKIFGSWKKANKKEEDKKKIRYVKRWDKCIYIEIIRNKYSNEDKAVQEDLYNLCFVVGIDEIISWGQSEIRCTSLLSEIERYLQVN